MSNGVVGSPAFAAFDQGMFLFPLKFKPRAFGDDALGFVHLLISFLFQGMMFTSGIFVGWSPENILIRIYLQGSKYLRFSLFYISSIHLTN